ncbi:hypothetical protein BLNAU_21060 [Blattamonas nauphoetae]|uniref:Uncharacterized protein n=1 Tax=Blattamonas nauphoetae TaxID=2049346 RepID=A0ABQ9WWW7_9EUKA|nr:hypothetical protein BLNAU_21060 [Blattamonas nauphoetae]
MAQALTPRGFEDRKTIHSTPVALTALSPLAIPFAIRASSCDNDAVNANPDTESAAEGAGKVGRRSNLVALTLSLSSLPQLLHGSLATWLSSSLFAVFQVITESVNVTHFSQPNSINMQAFSSSSPPLASRILIIFLSVRAEPHLYLFTISSALVLFFKASLPRRVSLVEMKRSRILAELPLMEPIQCFPHVILEVPLRFLQR